MLCFSLLLRLSCHKIGNIPHNFGRVMALFRLFCWCVGVFVDVLILVSAQ